MTNILTFDVETTHKEKSNGSTTPLPYFGNMLVAIGYKWLDEEDVTYDCYYHSTEPPTEGAFKRFQSELDRADIVIGHNIKFDLSWIRESNFKYEGKVYDTMVSEYILSKARRWALSLASVAEKYGGVQKEKDLITPYFKEGKTFYYIPWDTIVEYGIADVLATEQVALEQLKAFGSSFEEIFNEPVTHTTLVV
jgi:DNA polymerase I-like protein with 3'-5' exonuclease and polymerase domains